jgi:uncharacterized spore protein YtfJ
MEPNDMLSTLAEHVRTLVQSETVIGQPLTVGTATVIPVTRVTFGFGGGGGSGEAAQGEKAGRAGGTGSGGGVGVRMEPAAFIVMQDDKLQVLAAPGKRGALGDLFERVPDLVEKISAAQAERKGRSGGTEPS